MISNKFICSNFNNNYSKNNIKTFPLLLPKKEVFLQKDKYKNK